MRKNYLFLHFVNTFFAILFASIAFSQTPATYSTSGTYSWTVPPCVTSITVQVWGGGGGGGGTSSKQGGAGNQWEACTGGGGGGGGGYTTQTYTVVPGQTYSIVVGAGGTGGTGTNNNATAGNGGNGGTSTFTGPAVVSVLTATGGLGGGGATANNTSGYQHIGSNGNGGSGGTGSNGTTNSSGGIGSDGSHSGGCADLSGAGGGAGSGNGNGGNGQQILGCPHTVAMSGGSGVSGGGSGGNGIKGNINGSKDVQNGNSGSSYGGGGGGGNIHLNNWPNTWVTSNGGNGADGAVVITWDDSATPPNDPNPTTPQSFCQTSTDPAPTIGDLIPDNPLQTGVTYIWYDAATNGNILNASTLLTDGTTYYVSAKKGGCESNRVAVTVHISQKPTADAGENVTIDCGMSVQIGTTPPTEEPEPCVGCCGIDNTSALIWSGGMGGAYINAVKTLGGITTNIDNSGTYVDGTDPVLTYVAPNRWYNLHNEVVDAYQGGQFTMNIEGNKGPAGATVTDMNTYNTYNVYAVRIWIDWNNDGFFNEQDERVYTSPLAYYPDPPGSSTFYFNGIVINVPPTATAAQLRMRIRIKYGSPYNDTDDNACAKNSSNTNWNDSGGNLFDNGLGTTYNHTSEIEDYYVQIIASGGSNPTTGEVTYDWTPPTNLDDPTSPTPTANPSTTTTYTVTVTSGPNCFATDQVTVTVNNNTVPTFTQIPDLCVGETPIPTLPTQSTNTPSITGTWNPATIDNMTEGTTTYTFTPNAGQCGTTTTMDITVNPNITPTFDPIAPLCEGITPIPTLPSQSTNTPPVTGTWNPAVISNTTTTTYHFTPASTECTDEADLQIVVNPKPTFTVSGTNPSSCNATDGSITISGLTPNTPYTYSYSGGTGTATTNASGEIVLTNIPAGTYTNFSVDAGTCPSDVSTVSIVIATPDSPTVDVSPAVTICEGTSTTITASNFGGATLSWNNGLGTNPSNSVSPTSTTTYTVTASENGCNTPASVTVTVTPKATPSFTNPGPICAGTPLTLPTESNNIQGTWSPAVNNTTTTTYHFTPASTECSDEADLQIVVNPKPTFTVSGTNPSSCNATDGSITISGLTANTSYTYSYSGGTGTATTNASGEIVLTNIPAGTYTNFTVDAGTCPSDVSTVSIVITTPDSPTVNVSPAVTICEGTSTTITASNFGGATLSWNNGLGTNASNSVSPASTTTYTVTASENGCSSSASVTVTVTPKATPSFTNPGPICAGTPLTLPTESNNIQGTWSPAVNNTTTTTYTFTPASTECATTSSMTIIVNNLVNPVFTFSDEVCEGAVITLPSTSNNGVVGGWSPTVNNSQTTTYTFTPNGSTACAQDTSITIQVNPKVIPQFTQIDAICIGETFTLPTASLNGIQGSWSPATNLNMTTTYTFTPNVGECSQTAQMTVVVNPLPNVNAGVDATICLGASTGLTATGAIAYVWDNNLGTGITQTISPDSTTVYAVTGIDVNGCQNTDTVIVNVMDGLAVTFSADTLEGCSPMVVQFSSTSLTGVDYVWNFGDGQTSTNSSPTHSYTGEGCYTVSLTVNNSVCSYSTSINNMICVHPTPNAAFTASTYGITNINSSVTFTNQSVNATNYAWNFGDETGVSNEESPSYTYDPSIIRNNMVTLIASNDYGCADTATTVIKMDEEISFFVPNTFTPDGDQFNNVFKPVFAKGFDLFEYELMVFDRWGEIIFESHDVNIGWDGTYSLSGKICQDGVYVWRIRVLKIGSSDKIEKTGHVLLLR